MTSPVGRPSFRPVAATSSRESRDAVRDKYEPSQIEPVWRSRWKKARLFEVADPSLENLANKYYVLEMLPYPSGRIHMGHVRNYSIGDVLARFHRMRGKHVLHPMGWDAFGMPAENAAIERGRHPADWTHENIQTMRSQLEPLGFTYDWSREVATCDPEYYRWEQLIFTRMMAAGLAYKKKATVNWSVLLETVLANEQVVDGKCWRTGGPVEQRDLSQWFIRITGYAEELLEGLEGLKGKWPDQVLAMQRQWIGKSVGAKVKFAVPEAFQDVVGDVSLEVFTTRPDTLYGVTFLSLAPEHPIAKKLATDKPEIKAFLERMAAQPDRDRASDTAPKEGIATGISVIHPLTGESIPVYLASFVLMGYGTGAVMAVPAHDQRDFQFAKEHNLPIRVVIQPVGDQTLSATEMTEAYTGPGTMSGSDVLDGTPNEAGKAKVIQLLRQKRMGEEAITYRLRDWLISRQRYWGCPIPVIYGADGATLPVPDVDLPVLLPRDVKITGEGGSPLARHPAFVDCQDPRDPSKRARRETDTFDTFWESSWYYLRYTSPKYAEGPVDPKIASAWMPVDRYIGGIEHAVMHLLYARFFHKVMIDLGFLPRSTPREPFANLLTQGMVCMQTSFTRDEKGLPHWLYPEQVDEQGKSRVDGKPVELGRIEKMSKSRKNVVDPDAMVARFGSDTVRAFMLFAAPPEAELIWSDTGIEGSYRFLSRVYRVVREASQMLAMPSNNPCPEAVLLRRKLHQTVVRVTHDIEERAQFNTAIAALMELINELQPAVAKAQSGDPGGLVSAIRESADILVHLLSPFAPHLADELWATLGGEGFLLDRPWPTADLTAAREDTIEMAVQINGKVRGRITIGKEAIEEIALSVAKAEPNIAGLLEGKVVKKVIYVPGRILNLIVG